MKQRNSWFYLLLVAVTLATLYPFWTGHFYGTGDVRDVFIPLETFFRNQELKGLLPSWNPNIAWGFPVIASAQIGFFYPPLLLLRLLPVQLYLPIIFILHITLALFGTFIFARRIGISQTGAYLSAISFGLSAFVFEHATHLNIIMGIAWLPLSMLTARWLAEKNKIYFSHITLFSIVLALPFLAGHLQIPLLIALITSIYFLYERSRYGYKIAYSFLTLAIIALCAFALSAVQLLPTLELVKYSSRSLSGSFSIEQANQYSFAPYHIVTSIFPRFFSNGSTYWGKRIEIEYGFFIGTIPLLLALFAMRFKLSRASFFKWLGIGSFLMALGSLSPFRLLGIEPSLWFFSAPVRWLLFTTFAGSILTGLGLDLLKTELATFKKYVVLLSACIITLVIIGNAVLWLLPKSSPEYIYKTAQSLTPQIFTNRPDAYYINKFSDLIKIARTSSVSLASLYTWIPVSILLCTPFIISRRWGLRALIILSTAELVLIASTTSPYVPWSTLLNPPDNISLLPTSVKERQARIISIRQQGDSGKYLTNPSTNANNSVRAEQRKLLVPLIHAQFNIAGVEWPASLDISAHSAAVSSLRSSDSYEVTDVQKARSLNIETILAPNPTSGAIEIRNIGAAPRASLLTINGEVPAVYKEISPTKVEIKTNSNQPGTLVVRDSWYPGWQATIDGQEVPIELSNNFFRSVPVPSGNHTVRMQYRPGALYAGLAISVITTIVFAIMCLKIACHSALTLKNSGRSHI